MSAERTTPRLADPSPKVKAKIAGVLYLVNIVTSLIAFSGKGSHSLIVASGLTATASYIAVTILLYYLFKPVNARLSLLAALFSLAGCLIGVLGPFHVVPFHIHSLVFFGFYCVLIGVLIFRSKFLPRILGGFMGIAGVGWLTFLSPPLAASLSPYHYLAGGIGEGLLTLWLLMMGVDAVRWNEQASQQSGAN
jgi:uncharacterized protein DUF4386